MTLPFIIGEDSGNEKVFVDFEQLPHLFVSYSDEAQLQDFVLSLVTSLQTRSSGLPVHYALALSQSGKAHNLQFRSDCQFTHCFIAGNELASNIDSRLKFMQALSKEMRKRSKLMKKQLPHMVILIHDVFDIILSNKKTITQTSYSY